MSLLHNRQLRPLLGVALALGLALTMTPATAASDEGSTLSEHSSAAARLMGLDGADGQPSDANREDRPQVFGEDRGSGASISYQDQACFEDPSGDVQDRESGAAQNVPQADIVEHCADFREDELMVSMTLEQPTDPESHPNWASPDTVVVWALDTNFDPTTFEYSVEAFLDQASGDFIAVTFDLQEEGAPATCEVTARYNGTSYMASDVEPICFGSPQHVQLFSLMFYDSNPNFESSPKYVDIAPNDEGVTEVVAQTNGLPECGLYGQLTDSVDLVRMHCPGGPTEAIRQAVAISHDIFEPFGAAHVILARNDVFADALTGSSLSFGLGPVLFTTSDQLAPETRVEIRRVLQPNTDVVSTVYLLGGTAAISENVAAELTDLGYTVVRLAGPTRFETAAAVSRQLRELLRTGVNGTFPVEPVIYPENPRAGGDDANACPGDPEFPQDAFPENAFPDINAVILAYAFNWPDAVAAGSLGAFWGMPILLVDGPTRDDGSQVPVEQQLPAPTLQALREINPQCVYPVGGTSVISNEVLVRVFREVGPEGTVPPYLVRKAGSERTGTAIEIGRFFRQLLQRHGGNNVPGLGSQDENFALAVNIRREDAWAHILAASPVTGGFTGVFLPLEAADGSVITEPVRTFACEKPVDLIAIGGTDLVAQGSAETLLGHLTGQGCPA